MKRSKLVVVSILLLGFLVYGQRSALASGYDPKSWSEYTNSLNWDKDTFKRRFHGGKPGKELRNRIAFGYWLGNSELGDKEQAFKVLQEIRAEIVQKPYWKEQSEANRVAIYALYLTLAKLSEGEARIAYASIANKDPKDEQAARLISEVSAKLIAKVKTCIFNLDMACLAQAKEGLGKFGATAEIQKIERVKKSFSALKAEYRAAVSKWNNGQSMAKYLGNMPKHVSVLSKAGVNPDTLAGFTNQISWLGELETALNLSSQKRHLRQACNKYRKATKALSSYESTSQVADRIGRGHGASWCNSVDVADAKSEIWTIRNCITTCANDSDCQSIQLKKCLRIDKKVLSLLKQDELTAYNYLKVIANFWSQYKSSTGAMQIDFKKLSEHASEINSLFRSLTPKYQDSKFKYGSYDTSCLARIAELRGAYDAVIGKSVDDRTDELANLGRLLKISNDKKYAGCAIPKKVIANLIAKFNEPILHAKKQKEKADRAKLSAELTKAKSTLSKARTMLLKKMDPTKIETELTYARKIVDKFPNSNDANILRNSVSKYREALDLARMLIFKESMQFDEFPNVYLKLEKWQNNFQINKKSKQGYDIYILLCQRAEKLLTQELSNLINLNDHCNYASLASLAIEQHKKGRLSRLFVDNRERDRSQSFCTEYKTCQKALAKPLKYLPSNLDKAEIAKSRKIWLSKMAQLKGKYCKKVANATILSLNILAFRTQDSMPPNYSILKELKTTYRSGFWFRNLILPNWVLANSVNDWVNTLVHVEENTRKLSAVSGDGSGAQVDPAEKRAQKIDEAKEIFRKEHTYLKEEEIAFYVDRIFGGTGVKPAAVVESSAPATAPKATTAAAVTMAPATKSGISGSSHIVITPIQKATNSTGKSGKIQTQKANNKNANKARHTAKPTAGLAKKKIEPGKDLCPKYCVISRLIDRNQPGVLGRLKMRIAKCQNKLLKLTDPDGKKLVSIYSAVVREYWKSYCKLRANRKFKKIRKKAVTNIMSFADTIYLNSPESFETMASKSVLQHLEAMKAGKPCN